MPVNERLLYSVDVSTIDMRALLILIASTLCFSCGDSHHHTNIGFESKITAEAKQLEPKKDILDELSSQLTKDGFAWEIDTVYHDSLSFTLYSDNLEEVRSIQLQPQRIRKLSAKANTALKGTALYPRLVFQEACFADKIVTDSLIGRIEEIIRNQDPINEKTYDMVIKADTQHLIYVLTDAKAFEHYVRRYGELLRK